MIRFVYPTYPRLNLTMIRAVLQLAVCLGLTLGGGQALCAQSGPPAESLQSPSLQHKTWRQYGGGADQSKYMDLKEITKENVKQLQIIWEYTNGDNGVFWNPIVVDGVMYVLGNNSSLEALDAATGKRIWTHPSIRGIIRTGINYWESKDGKDRRLIFCAADTLQAIDATTGLSITNFGNNGATSLKEGMGRDPATIGRVQGTAPGQIYDNLIFVGCSPGEQYFGAAGHLRAYDCVTGKLVWVFHTVPFPGEFGYETWPKDAYKYVGGVNTWGEITVDEKNGIAFFPLGAPNWDYYGADRAGNDLFDECILALDARTGKRLWHFQTVHHGLWDYDLCAAPQLITVQHEGNTVEAVAVAGKVGFLYVFNRLTGEPLWPIVERPVPPSEVPEEHASPTQPFPTVVPPFTRQIITTNDINPYFSPEKRAAWVERIAAARTGMFQTLSDKAETIVVPGAVGGANRGCTAADPDKGIVYVISTDEPSVYKLRREDPIPSDTTRNAPSAPQEIHPELATNGRAVYMQTCVICHGTNMTGLGPVPSIVDAGTKLSLDQFRAVVTVGKGQMLGFPHMEEATIEGASCVSRRRRGNLRCAALRAAAAPAPADAGCGDASGAWGRNGTYGYPAGVKGPTNNYVTGYGLEYTDLLTPPWSTITAYDLNKGTIKWRSPLGQDRRYPSTNGVMTGLPAGEQRRSMIVTSTGLVFSTCADGKEYAYDADNGNLIWSTQLPRNTEGLQSMYEVNGRAYIAICLVSAVVDRSKPAPPPGYVVYGLPEKTGINQ